MTTPPPVIRMTDRENYLIESGKALFNEQNTGVARLVEDYETERMKVRAKADAAVAEIARVQEFHAEIVHERDALIDYLNSEHAEKCRAQKKGTAPHPFVIELVNKRKGDRK